MDLLEAVNKSKKYTLHSHTQFCDGHANMAEFAEQAVERGFDLYGFTPHSPIPFYSPCNMSKEDVPIYLSEVKRIQGQYPQVRFLAGMEIDYIDSECGPASPYFADLPLDYRIGSVHFIPCQTGEYIDIDGRYESFKQKMAAHFQGDIRYVVDTFFEQSQKMVKGGGFDIIGHFDKIKHNAGLFYPGLEDETWYKDHVDDLIDSIVASGLIVEVNTKAWEQHQQLFPSQKHWRRLLQLGVPMIVNSDAHYPMLIDASLEVAHKALNYINSQINRQIPK